MSKSKGNTVDPDAIIEKYGADSLRLFILFAAPPEDQLEWNDGAIDGSWRFLNRVWQLVEKKFSVMEDNVSSEDLGPADKDLERDRNATIKKVTQDLSHGFKFNTAISSIMILMNKIDKYKLDGEGAVKQALLNRAIRTVVLLLSPLTPHICEELWQKMGNVEESIIRVAWPHYDEDALKKDLISIVVQINGKLKGKFDVPAESTEDQIKEIVLDDQKIKEYLQGKDIRRFVYVPGKLANLVV